VSNDTTSTQQDALSSSHEEIDGIDNQQEPLICCVCGKNLNNVEVNAYIDPEDINKAYCENDWKLWELSHYQNVEEFAQYVGAYWRGYVRLHGDNYPLAWLHP
jgi:hypothetical protein